MNQKVVSALEKADALGAHFYFRKNGCACAIGQLIRELPEEKKAQINMDILATDHKNSLAGCTIWDMAMGVVRNILTDEYEVDDKFLQSLQYMNDNFTLRNNPLFEDYDKARRDYIINYVKGVYEK